mgnify:FL=1
MNNGIRSLPRYQHGGSTDPILDEKRQRLLRLMAEQGDAPQSRAGLPFSRPDTLVDEERGDMMRFFHAVGADTTQISQEGISDWLQGDEYGDILELVSQIRGQTPERYRRVAQRQRSPSVELYSQPHNIRGEYFHDEDNIKLNVLSSMIGQHGRRTNIKKGRESWEQEPEEALRSTLLHELGHSLNAWERGSDNFAAVVQALRSASPDAPYWSVLDAAQKIYWADSNAYKNQQAGDYQTGTGGYNDPLVVDPSFIEDSRIDQTRAMRSWLKKILSTEQYADHPLNRGWGTATPWPLLMDKLREGIGSLFRRRRES